MIPNKIRDIRESKNLSQDAVAQAAGITWSQFCRIEAGRGKTTQDEVDKVLRVLNKMKAGTRKLAGRPYNDKKKQAALEAARAKGGSVAEALAAVEATPSKKVTAAKKAPAKKASAKKTAPAKKATAKKAPAKKTSARKSTAKAQVESLI